MIIRNATINDRAAIVSLLKASLGESMIPKSAALWQWKHEDNPFGASYVLLAEENNQLIGLRAFLQWKWQNDNGVYKAVRAVDTATHPNHQGKGLFKKLTLQAVADCKENGIDFVFNTPNEKSRPGYLKMGWIDQGPMPVSIKPVRIATIVLRKLKKEKASDESYLATPDWKIISALPDIIPSIANQLQTVVSKAYINWRYGINPLFPYSFITDQHSYLLIYRIKSQGPIRELRVADIFPLHASVNYADLKKQFRKTVSLQKADIISVSYPNLQRWNKALGHFYIKTKGPLVTLRQLAINDSIFQYMCPNTAWNYSLGDLELF
jgi:N-acetylglutamate synthase-like GNAT family acetyltransferase